MSSSTELTAMKVLDKLYFSSMNATDKGTKFERFTQSFLQTDPIWSQQFEKVWMWDQWPEKWGPDTGIDLVAERRDGGRTAIQCKFYDPQSRVSKADIDTFLSASGRSGFTEGEGVGEQSRRERADPSRGPAAQKAPHAASAA